MLRSDEGYREAFFWEYCSKCKYGDLKENKHPCCCCLDEPLNMESHKPVKWEGNDGYEDFIFKPEMPSEQEPEPEKPSIKNLFNEEGTGYDDGLTYSLEKDTHASTFTTTNDTKVNQSSNPIISLPISECLGKTLHVRADSTILSIATAYSFNVSIVYGSSNAYLGEISTFGGSSSILIPEDVVDWGATGMSISVVVKSSRDGVTLPKGSYVKLIKLMFSWEKADEWSPYQKG